MERLIKKFENKLVSQGLVGKGDLLIGARDVIPSWNDSNHPVRHIIEPIFVDINCNSVFYAIPAEPYRTIIAYLAGKSPDGRILPKDSETRTFLHELPVIDKMTSESIVERLRCRKCVITADGGIVTFGTVSPEQAFVTYSSVCFATFVKYFDDYRRAVRAGSATAEDERIFTTVCETVKPVPACKDHILTRGAFSREKDVLTAIAEAGRLTVDYGLVDSYFGNISYRMGETLYISQTGSSLDELTGSLIDPCPLDGSSCVGMTASSELSAHHAIVTGSDARCVLHGHPRFAVIESMDCQDVSCPYHGRCHIFCPKDRSVGHIPIVSGEIGTGKHGLCTTVPAALSRTDGVIVYGHGVFTTGIRDFNKAFQSLVTIERFCFDHYFSTVHVP